MLFNRGDVDDAVITVPFSKFSIPEEADCYVGDVWDNMRIERLKNSVTRYCALDMPYMNTKPTVLFTYRKVGPHDVAFLRISDCRMQHLDL